jgi:hypothetical protein
MDFIGSCPGRVPGNGRGKQAEVDFPSRRSTIGDQTAPERFERFIIKSGVVDL